MTRISYIHQIVAGLSTALWLLRVSLAAAAPGDKEESNLVAIAASIHLGEAAVNIAEKLEPAWIPVGTNTFLPRHPFNRLVPYTNTAVVVEWRSKDPFGGWPLILFAVFDTPAKTNLVDALLFNSAGGLHPMVNGLYNRNLMQVKKGASLKRIYSLLGKRDGDYHPGPDEKWRVDLLYWGYNGELMLIRVDAATGIVIEVDNVGRV